MGRPGDDESWNQVIKIAGNRWECKHCHKKYAGGATRIKEHLGTKAVTGNIELCPHSAQFLANRRVNNGMLDGSNYQVEPLIQANLQSRKRKNTEEAAGADGHQIRTTANFDQNDMAGPGNIMVEEVGGYQDTISACFDGPIHQNDAAGPSNMVQGSPHSNELLNTTYFEVHIKKVNELLHELSSWEEQVKEEWHWLEYCGRQDERKKADDWLQEAGDLKKEGCQIIDSFHQDAFHDLQMKVDDFENKLDDMEFELGVPLYVDMLSTVDSYFIKMRDLLWDDNVFFIGVCGMGGVGKTWLVTHFRNQIRRNKSFHFENVFWITVSQDFSILKLQNSIAKSIGEKLDNVDEIIDRADILSYALGKMDRSVLILDDVWNYIDLQRVGIPLKKNGIKLILTSRLHHVFQQMDCPTPNLMQMQPFYQEDDQGWKLFLLKHGCDGTPATLSSEVEEIARSVVEMCDGLPLGINVMARLMKGVNNDINIWKHTLSKLQNSEMPKDMEEEVIKVLKRSYDHLGNTNIQNCFLQLALYCEDREEVFIMNLVHEGLIQPIWSLEKIFVEGQTILAKLNSHSLIHLSDRFWHNGLMRDMASDIVKGRFMVKCKKGLRNIPEMQEWAPHLEKVSLMDNDIQEIPEGTSPKCTQLSTLNLSKNKISYIPDCFFDHLKALCLLDLSYNKDLTFLPNSLSSLICLKSLLLEFCSSLKSVPPLGNLQELSRLVISGTSIEKVPDGLGKLVNLRWLDLSNNTKLECVAWSVISSLTNLQYLILKETSITGEVECVEGMMSKLEYFAGSFQDAKNFADFVENIPNRYATLKYYHINLLSPCILWGATVFGSKKKCITVRGFEGYELLLPPDLDELKIENDQEWSGDLCGAFSFKAAASLREIDVRGCPKVERLCCLRIHCSFCQHLQNLQSLILTGLGRLDAIWREDDEFIGLPNLSHLKIWKCDRMERLMSAASLAKLPKLESIYVHHCLSMKEIFARGTREDDPDLTITLPNSFRVLYIDCLPQLVGATLRSSIIVSKTPPKVKVSYFDIQRLGQSHIRYKPSPSASESIIYFTKT